jgi:ribonuclease HI
MEKICYVVIMSARKLHHYFEAHTIKVVTNQPLNDIFSNRNISNRINKQAMKLSEYVVDFEKRSAIKSHILADFVTEWTKSNSRSEDTIPKSPWPIYFDGAWGSTEAGAAVVLVSPSGIKLRHATKLQFTKYTDKSTNNIVEYEAILLGFHKLTTLRVRTCILKTDSKDDSNQIEKECIAREPTLEKYLALVRRIENHFRGFTVEYIERSKNSKANELVKVAARNTPLPMDVFFQVTEDASVKTVELELGMINVIKGED